MTYDVSVAVVNGMVTWPSDPPVKLTPQSHPSRDQSHTVRLTNVELGSHTGTHIDAPWHMLDGGRRLNQIPLETLIGPASVLEFPRVRSIRRSDLESWPPGNHERLLFKTDNSRHWSDGRFYESFVYLEPDAAEFLVQHNVKLVGIDYLSIDRFKSENHPVHRILLQKNIVIVEGLNLSSVPVGSYHMIALPLNLQDVDGAPARVVLMDTQ